MCRKSWTCEVAGLPSELDPEGEEAKRAAHTHSAARDAASRTRLRAMARPGLQLAELLEENAAIPVVREQMALIQNVQTDD